MRGQVNQIRNIWNQLQDCGYLSICGRYYEIDLDQSGKMKRAKGQPFASVTDPMRNPFTRKSRGVKLKVICNIANPMRAKIIVQTDYALKSIFIHNNIPLTEKTALVFCLLHEVGHLEFNLSKLLISYDAYRALLKETAQEIEIYERNCKIIDTYNWVDRAKKAEKDSDYRRMTAEEYADNFALRTLIRIIQERRINIM